MEVPNILKGHLYPSSRVCRCPRFSRCIVSNKCQNYDRHNLECSVCESRVNPPYELGGQVPEGKVWPDLQAAVKAIQDMKQAALAHPDREGEIINGQDITNKFEKQRKAAEVLAYFTSGPKGSMEEKIVYAQADEETRKLLGRME